MFRVLAEPGRNDKRISTSFHTAFFQDVLLVRNGRYTCHPGFRLEKRGSGVPTLRRSELVLLRTCIPPHVLADSIIVPSDRRSPQIMGLLDWISAIVARPGFEQAAAPPTEALEAGDGRQASQVGGGSRAGGASEAVHAGQGQQI